MMASQDMGRWVRLAAFFFVAWVFFAWVAALALSAEAELPHADALVVLGGSATYRERTAHAAQLYREGRAPKIILTNDHLRSGWSDTQRRNPYFVERAADDLRRAGVPAERIEVLPQTVSSTHDEALMLREHATVHGLRSVLVVTSAYHSRRALWTFRRILRDSNVDVGLSAVAPGQQTP